jgi:hypothetical protein
MSAESRFADYCKIQGMAFRQNQALRQVQIAMETNGVSAASLRVLNDNQQWLRENVTALNAAATAQLEFANRMGDEWIESGRTCADPAPIQSANGIEPLGAAAAQFIWPLTFLGVAGITAYITASIADVLTNAPQIEALADFANTNAKMLKDCLETGLSPEQCNQAFLERQRAIEKGVTSNRETGLAVSVALVAALALAGYAIFARYK